MKKISRRKFLPTTLFNGINLIDLNSFSNSPELPHIITTKPKLKILIDSSASLFVINPEIALELFPNYIFPHKFEIKSVLNRKERKYLLTQYYANSE